jgi:cytochrome b subunit of formate dehydrogenase
MKGIKKNKAKINYVVDIVIGAGFLLAAASGLVLFFAGSSGGYQGGRNPHYARAVLGMSRDVWKSLHDYSSIVMIVGVLGHFILHWNWLVCMTRNLFRRERRRARGENAARPQECRI